MNNPYQHKQAQGSPRAFQARENNALDIIKNLAAQVNPVHPTGELQQQFADPLEQPMGDFGIAPQEFAAPQMDLDAIAFDEEGNFKKPPYEGFWADRLAEVDPENPLIEHGRKIRGFLDEIDKATRR